MDDGSKDSPSSPRFYSVSFQDRFTEVTPLLASEEDNSPSLGSGKRTKSLSQVPNYSSIKEKNQSLILCCHGKEIGNCCNNDDVNVDFRSEEVPPSEGHPCHAVRYSFDDRNARRKLIVASVLCLIFMLGEVIGGYLANSLAIMTDAAHLLTDFASFMISLFSLYLACRPATKRLSFGWYRAEVIGALTSVILIWVVTGILVYIAIERIVNKNYDIEADIMLITSGVGVAVNIIMGFVLHCQGHGHSHGGLSHDHSHDGKKDENINVRAAFIHVIGDFLQSVGVFVAALIIYYKPGWEIVDPICTFIFSVLVLGTTIAILKDVMTVLMEGIPKGINFNEVKEAFMNIPGVVKVHNLRIWCLSLDKVALAAHIVISPGVNTQEVLKHASRLVRQRFTFFEMTLQIEDYHEDMLNCTQCQGPPD